MTAAADAKPAFRAPKLDDLVFSAKAFGAAVFALGFGFWQGFENPYWSALTVYVVFNPPGAGAVRSKSIFRLVGTLIGGGLILFFAGFFADQPALLLASLITVVVVATFLNRTDRKPTNYIWFAVAVTSAAVGLARMSQLSDLFDIVTARIGEIVFGILVASAVDGLFWPRVQTPAFLADMAEWRGKARDWVIGSLADRDDAHDDHASETRRKAGIEALVAQIVDLDAKGVQLPFDPVPLAARSRHVDLLRAKIVHLVAAFGSIETWAGALRAGRAHSELGAGRAHAELGAGRAHSDLGTGASLRADLAPSLDAVAAWLRIAPVRPGASIDRHVADGEALARDLEVVRLGIDPSVSRTALLQHGLLVRLVAFVRDWSDLATTLVAIESGGRLPARLADEARRAKPVRSVDRLAAARDVAPMFVAMGVTAFIWYLTNWNAGLDATIFAFVAGILLIGQNATLKTAGGSLVLILFALALDFVYQFAILPRVTEFPVLVLVLGCMLLPLGVLMSINPAGLLVAMLFFSVLGLQNVYRIDADQTLQILSGGVTGYTIGVFCLRLFDYDRPRFATRRLVDAARLDVVDVARSTRPIDAERYLSLAVDRVSLFFKSAGELEDEAKGDAAPPGRLMDDLAIGRSLLALRRLEPEVSPHAQATIRRLASEVARAFRAREERVADGVLDHVVASAIDDPAVARDPERTRLLDALTGIQLALGDRASPDATRPVRA